MDKTLEEFYAANLDGSAAQDSSVEVDNSDPTMGEAFQQGMDLQELQLH